MEIDGKKGGNIFDGIVLNVDSTFLESTKPKIVKNIKIKKNKLLTRKFVDDH